MALFYKKAVLNPLLYSLQRMNFPCSGSWKHTSFCTLALCKLIRKSRCLQSSALRHSGLSGMLCSHIVSRAETCKLKPVKALPIGRAATCKPTKAAAVGRAEPCSWSGLALHSSEQHYPMAELLRATVSGKSRPGALLVTSQAS